MVALLSTTSTTGLWNDSSCTKQRKFKESGTSNHEEFKVVEKKSYISINKKEKEPYSRSYQRVTSCRKIKIKILSSLYIYIFLIIKLFVYLG